MNIIAQKRIAINSSEIRELDFSEERYNKRLGESLEWSHRIKEEEFWGGIRTRAKRSLQQEIEEWLGLEVRKATGGQSYERVEERHAYRSGAYLRDLVTTFGKITGLKVPKMRKRKDGKRGWEILNAYRRHRIEIDELIKGIYLGGVSTRQVQWTLKPVLGRYYSAQTVSSSLRRLDRDVEAFHRRRIRDDWDYLLLDGINVKIRIAGKVRKKSILAAKAFKVNEKGSVIKEEIIAYQIARKGESTASWESFVNNLYERGLEGKNLRMITIDGNLGLMNALDMVYPRVPKQRCWQHKMRNTSNYCRVKYQSLITDSARKIYQAESKREALKAFKNFKQLCNPLEPKAVRCIEKDLPDLLHSFDQPRILWKKLRTTNSIERSFREVRRRIRTITTFTNEPSCDRIVFGVISKLNETWRLRLLKIFAKSS